MRRMGLLVLFMMLFVNLVWADSNLYNTKKGATVLLKSVRNNNDSTANIAITSGLDLSNFKYAVLDLVLGGTSPQYTITPYFIDGAKTAYASGTSVTITQSTRAVVEVNGCADFNVRCDNSSGTAPTIAVYITGVTE